MNRPPQSTTVGRTRVIGAVVEEFGVGEFRVNEDQLYAVAGRFEFEPIPCPSCSDRTRNCISSRCANCEDTGRLWQNAQGQTLSDHGLQRLDMIHRGPE